MNFERKIEGDTVSIITNKDFMLSSEVNVMNGYDALHFLLSKKINKITFAENKDGKIYITRHFCTCPLCGNRFPSYKINENSTKSPYLRQNVTELCDNQLSLFPEKKTKSIFFKRPMKIGSSVKCPHCEFEGVISNETINCTITVNQNKLRISCKLQTLFDVMTMRWFPKKVLSFDDAHCSETISFDLQNGSVSASLNCGSKTLCSVPIISEKALGKNDPWLKMFKNKRVFREIKRSFEKIYGTIPFLDKFITFESFILLTKFVGYPAEFYRDLPLSIDNEAIIIPEEFESISNELHFCDSVPSVLLKINIPKSKSIKRIVVNRPSILIYEKELERLWKIINNIDLFCELLTCKNAFPTFAFFHLYPGIDSFFINLRNTKGVVWVQKMLISNCCYSLCLLGIKYLSSNYSIQRKLLQNDFKDYKHRNNYYGGEFYFSVPMPCCSENNLIYSGSGFQFILLTTLKDYYIAGRELHNCLDTYSPYGNSHVYIIKKFNNTLAAIEIIDNTVVQAFCKNNTPIKSLPLVNAITVWAEHNSFSF